MAIIDSIDAKNSRPAYEASSAGDTVCVPFEFDIARDNAGVAVASGDIVRMGKIPQGHSVYDLILDAEAVGGTVNVGYVNEAGDAAGAEFISGQALTSAVHARADVAGATLVAPSKKERFLALAFTAAGTATSGKVRLNVLYRATDFGR